MKRIHSTSLKFIYALFVLWVGVLSPLVYFDLFASNHFVQPYHFVLFKSVSQTDSSDTETLAPQLKQRLLQRFTSRQDFIATSSLPSGSSHLFQWAMSQLFLAAGIVGGLLLFFGRLSSTEQLNNTSANLSPPDKPPRLIATPA